MVPLPGSRAGPTTTFNVYKRGGRARPTMVPPLLSSAIIIITHIPPSNAHHKNGIVHQKYRLVDLCRVCGCKLRRGIKAKGKAVKPEPPYSCIFYTDKLVDAPEIHP